jgi:hypothetical protein
MPHECKFEDSIKEMHTDLREIRKDVRELHNWKLKVVSGVTVLWVALVMVLKYLVRL